MSSLVIDREMRTWRRCLVCHRYALTESSPIACPCGVEYGRTEREPVTQIEMVHRSRRSTLCENCGQLMTVLVDRWNPAGGEFCEPCRTKASTRELLTAQLRIVQGFGHTDTDCEVCSIQNQIDSLDGYDWREWRDSLIEKRPDLVVRAIHETRTHTGDDMPRISEMINSNYLKKEDVEDDTIVTITGCKQANIAREDQDADFKWLMKFKEFDKPLVLNSTNIQLTARATGEDNSEDWPGHQVVLYVDENVTFGGKLVGGLRIKALKKQKAGVAAQAPPTGKAVGSGPYDQPPDDF